MYAFNFPLMSNPEIRYMKFNRLVALLPQFTFTPRTYEGGQKIQVRGPGVVPFYNDLASADDGDDFTAAGWTFCMLNEHGLISEAVMSNLLER